MQSFDERFPPPGSPKSPKSPDSPNIPTGSGGSPAYPANIPMPQNPPQYPVQGPIQNPGLTAADFGRSDPWGDWDPSRARNGYTSKMPALSAFPALPSLPPSATQGGMFPNAAGFGQPGASGGFGGSGVFGAFGASQPAAIDLPTPAAIRQRPAGAMDALSPAALALSARADTEDYLTVTYDLHEPGFAELYDALIAPQWSVPFGQLLLSVFLTLPRDTGWQVLDVACGAGYPTLELARFLGQDCDLAGIDVWEEAILLARRKATEEWLRNVTFLVADVAESGLPDGSFDTLTCNLGLTSFADRARALGAMWRLLRPRGQLLLTLPLQSAMREFLDIYYLTLRDLKLDDYMRAFGQLVALRPTMEDAQRMVERAGFETQRMATDSFTLRFPTTRAFLTSPVIQTTYMASWRAIVADTTVRRLVFNEVERRLDARIAANGGELVMTVPMLCVSAIRV